MYVFESQVYRSRANNIGGKYTEHSFGVAVVAVTIGR